jgi:hypothetical protein
MEYFIVWLSQSPIEDLQLVMEHSMIWVIQSPIGALQLTMRSFIVWLRQYPINARDHYVYCRYFEWMSSPVEGWYCDGTYTYFEWMSLDDIVLRLMYEVEFKDEYFGCWGSVLPQAYQHHYAYRLQFPFPWYLIKFFEIFMSPSFSINS